MTDSLGIIEMKGLPSNIFTFDMMLKYTNIQLIGQVRIRGGFVSTFVRGKEDAVLNAVIAGIEELKRLGAKEVSYCVIPRPDPQVWGMVREGVFEPK